MYGHGDHKARTANIAMTNGARILIPTTWAAIAAWALLPAPKPAPAVMPSPNAEDIGNGRLGWQVFLIECEVLRRRRGGRHGASGSVGDCQLEVQGVAADRVRPSEHDSSG